jgi:hypothetical protein
MIIDHQRAFWMLDYYRTHERRLVFGANVLGEEAACVAAISYVWPESYSIGIRVFSDDGAETWDRLIPLKEARFLLAQMGEPTFEQFRTLPFHSLLLMAFPDGAVMFLAETALLYDGDFGPADFRADEHSGVRVRLSANP